MHLDSYEHLTDFLASNETYRTSSRKEKKSWSLKLQRLEKVEATLNEYRHELEVLRKALGVVLDETPLLPSKVEAEPIVERQQGIDVSDLTLLKQDWERKFASL